MAEDSRLAALAAEIVSSYVGATKVSPGELPDLIRSVHGALQNIDAPPELPPERAAPAVPIKKSITPDFLVSLFDGRKMKSLKRYLATKHNMTPDEYRAHWGLPRDYPMVAPNYAAQRSELAKKVGLGRKADPEPEPAPAPAKRTRKPKAAQAASPPADSPAE